MEPKFAQLCEFLPQQLTAIETKLNHTKTDLETLPQDAQIAVLEAIAKP
ncbi:hypothetical protein [[Phormidium ambiguum] IAM M-71]|nr:hypothetical protein [Phormidium ambiguum]